MPRASWRQVIADQVYVRAKEAQRKSRGAGHRVSMNRIAFSRDVQPYLVKAANQRGISLSGYIRRATMAHVALDLGMEATDLFEIDLQINAGDGPNKLTRDLDGERFGRWEVEASEPGGGS